MTLSRRTFVSWLCPALAAAQTLAHPGWRGNGITAERWWQHAAVAQVPAAATFAEALAALDEVSAAGADTLLLPDLQPEPNETAPFADRFGSVDDLDMLLREVSARRMHVLLTVPLLRLANNSSELQFWLARGIGGFSTGTLRPADVDTLHLLRAAVDRAPGQRLLLVSLDAGRDSAARFGRDFHPPTLRLLSQAEAVSLPGGMAGAVTISAPATAPALHGLLPVFALSALQTEAGVAGVRQWLGRSRAKAARSSVHRR